MHILCIYQHYANFDCANSGRLFTFLKHLGKNHKVTLVAGDSWESSKITDLYPWVPENVNYVPIHAPYSNNMNSFQRLNAYARFPALALIAGRKIKPDIIYGISTPLMTGWAAARLARHHNVPWVFEIRDIWPEFPVQMGAVKNALVRRALYKMERDLYHDASHVVTVSTDMTDHVVAHNVDASRVTTLLQGTNIDLASEAIEGDPDSDFNFGNRKAVLYAGTFGRANAIPSVLEAAEKLRHHDDLVFVFTGDGYHRSDIAEQADKNSNIVLLPPIPRHRVLKLFRQASVSLVPFSNLPVLATNSPAKFFDSLSVGTPVVVTNPGWTKSFVEDHHCGYYAPIDDTENLAEIILTAANSSDKQSIMAQNSIRIARDMFDRDKMARELETIFIDVVEGTSA